MKDQLRTLGQRLLPYLWAVAATGLGIALRVSLTPALGRTLPFITLFPAIFLVAYLGGLGPTVLATFLGALAALYLVIEPHSLSLADPVAQLGTALFAVSGIATGLLGEARLRAHRRASVAALNAETEAARAEQEALRAEEEAARAEEEMLRAEEETARADHEAQRAAREAERVERILASITDAFMTLDHRWTITYMNERAATLAGGKPAHYIGRNHWDAFPESVGGPFDQAYRRAVTNQVPVRLEAYYPPIAKWVEATAYPSADGLTVVAQDVTDRVRAHEERNRLAAIVESSEDAIIGKKLDGTVTSWNAAAERIFGYSASEMVGQSIYKLIPPELHDVEREVLRRVTRGEPLEFSEAERIRSDGQRIYIALTISPIRDASGKVIGASSIKRDITARRQAEERMRQSERMEMVGRLAGGVAHEANNQMTVVLGAANFLLGRNDLADDARKDLEYIREAAERTAGITTQLLAFSRRQIVQARVLDLDEAVRGLEGVLRRALGERSILVLQARADARVKVDPGQLAQVLLNLVLNARDAMPLGGRVTVETSVRELTESYARQHPGVAIQAGPYAVITVSDTGHGMSPETLGRIFEPFYTTKPIGKGSGLGLATVYGIVKQSGGYVWAYSELTRGTAFKVYLPLETAPTPEISEVSRPARAAGEIVLLVEDDAPVRHMTARVLEELGYEVLEAEGSHRALELLEQRDRRVDLLITDVVLPGMDGPELARRATELKPRLPILFISGYTDEDIVRRGLIGTGQPFLQKPFTPEGLGAEVAALLKHHRLSETAGQA
jgi:PAS domain S-box-containing protein